MAQLGEVLTETLLWGVDGTVDIGEAVVDLWGGAGSVYVESCVCAWGCAVLSAV